MRITRHKIIEGKYVGDKYEATKKLSKLDIIKLIRQDLKDEAKICNEFGKCGFSVKAEGYAGAKIIHIIVVIPNTTYNYYTDARVLGSLAVNIEEIGNVYNYGDPGLDDDGFDTIDGRYKIKVTFGLSKKNSDQYEDVDEFIDDHQLIIVRKVNPNDKPC